jgi:hypothetical protein
VRSRHGHKGGHRPASGRRGQRHGRLLPRGDHRGRVGLRDAEALRQGRQGAGGGITEGTQCSQQRGQEDVDPLMGFALDHAAQAPLETWRL